MGYLGTVTSGIAKAASYVNPLPQNGYVAAAGSAAGWLGKQAFYAYGMESLPVIANVLGTGARAGLLLGGSAALTPVGEAVFGTAAWYGATVLGNYIAKRMSASDVVGTVAKTDLQKALIPA